MFVLISNIECGLKNVLVTALKYYCMCNEWAGIVTQSINGNMKGLICECKMNYIHILTGNSKYNNNSKN